MEEKERGREREKGKSGQKREPDKQQREVKSEP